MAGAGCFRKLHPKLSNIQPRLGVAYTKKRKLFCIKFYCKSYIFAFPSNLFGSSSYKRILKFEIMRFNMNIREMRQTRQARQTRQTRQNLTIRCHFADLPSHYITVLKKLTNSVTLKILRYYLCIIKMC